MDQTPNQTKAIAANAMLLRKPRRRVSNNARPARHRAVPSGDSSQMMNFVNMDYKALSTVVNHFLRRG